LSRAKFFDLPKLDGLGRAGLSTSRFESHFLAVITKRTFEGATVIRIALHYSERTRHNAITAAIADVRLNINAAKFRAYDGPGRASFKAPGVLAMLADIGSKRPAVKIDGIAAEARLGRAFYKFDVTPCRVTNRAGVVVRVARPVKSIVSDAVPFFAGDLAGFASDAESRVGQESGGWHVSSAF
jgi:hypothetical protein